MRLFDRFPRSVTRLTRAAAIVALVGLATFAYGLFVPKPLPVILSMSIGHGLGVLALLLYGGAIAVDLTRRHSEYSRFPTKPITSEPPPSTHE